MKIACLQMRSGTDQTVNADNFEAMVREAAMAGCTYVQSPEMTGMVQKNRETFFRAIKTPADTPTLQRAEALANELNIVVHVGSCATLRQDGKIANRSFIFTKGALKPVIYDKIHMFDAEVSETEKWRESATFEPGTQAVGFDLNDTLKLGLSICYDLRFPSLYRSYARAGCNVLSAPAAFTVPTGKAHWETLIRSRAIENGAYVVCAAQGGEHEDGRVTYGHSMVVDPWGNITQLDHDEPRILYAELSADLSKKARTSIPVLQNERTFDALPPLQNDWLAV